MLPQAVMNALGIHPSETRVRWICLVRDMWPKSLMLLA